jgi:N-acetylglucosamine kinase-like BadF-type ATPase
LTKGEIAAFATETQHLAERGDAVARELYRLAARELGEQIAAVIRRTGLSSQRAVAFPVGLIGGGFKAGALFVEPIAEAVRAHAPEALVSVVKTAPVSGSLLLAARACGRSDALDPAELLRLIDAAVDQED